MSALSALGSPTSTVLSVALDEAGATVTASGRMVSDSVPSAGEGAIAAKSRLISESKIGGSLIDSEAVDTPLVSAKMAAASSCALSSEVTRLTASAARLSELPSCAVSVEPWAAWAAFSLSASSAAFSCSEPVSGTVATSSWPERSELSNRRKLVVGVILLGDLGGFLKPMLGSGPGL